MGKRIFKLAVPIYASNQELPKSVSDYVTVRKDRSFKPHSTLFLQLDRKVYLQQEVPFEWGFQPEFRGVVDQFWNLAKHCSQMLSEIALEEKYKEALYLDTDLTT